MRASAKNPCAGWDETVSEQATISPMATRETVSARQDVDVRRKVEFVSVYLIALAIAGLTLRVFPRLSLLLPLTFPLALLDAKPKKFLIAWAPVSSIVVAYDLMRGAIDANAAYVNYTALPALESALFGGQPIVWLQAHLLPLVLGPFGIVTTLVYFSHFFVPVVLLYVLWRRDVRSFVVAAISLATLSFAGYFTFLLFPAAPPWMAAEAGNIAPVTHVVVNHLAHLYTVLPSLDLSAAYGEMTANPVAPFPSLHAGYALMMGLWIWSFFRTRRWLAIAYPLAVSFVVVLYAEHYVVDVLGGWLYAASSFGLALTVARHRLLRSVVAYLEG